MSSLFASLGAADDVDDSLWGDGGLFSNNPVQDILDREEGFTLEDLLDEDELIQEVKHLNTKLITFLSRRDTVRKLVEYVTRDDTQDEHDVLAAATAAEAEREAATEAQTGENPSSGEGEEAGIMSGMPHSVMQVLHEREKLGRFAYTASEIFCCEVPGVNCHLVEDAATIERRTAAGGDGTRDAMPEQLPGDSDVVAVPEKETETETKEEVKTKEDEQNTDDTKNTSKESTSTASIPSTTSSSNDGPLIANFFSILHRPELSPRTAGYLEKIVDVFLAREQESLMNWVDRHPELLKRFVHHLGSISVSNVFRKLLDATDRQPPSTEEDEEDVPPGPGVSSSFEMSALSGDSNRRILWAGKLDSIATMKEEENKETKETNENNENKKNKKINSASMFVVETILNVFTESGCDDDKYVSAGDALIDCVNRSTAQETILSLQSDEPPRNTPTELMRALNTTKAAQKLMSAAVSSSTAKCAVQGCLSVLVRLIEWHAQNLQFEADERLPTETLSEDSDDDDATSAEAKTPRASTSSLSSIPMIPLTEDQTTATTTTTTTSTTPSIELPLLVAEVVSNMDTLMEGLLKHPDVPDRTFSNRDRRKPFGLVRLQAVELFTHMVYVRHTEVATCMMKRRVILKCLEFCFEYELNNTLHGLVAQAVASMCEEFDLATTVDDYRGLFVAIDNQPNLIDVVLNAYDNSDVLEKGRNYCACYMGHLHIIANTIHESSIKSAQMMEQNPNAYDAEVTGKKRLSAQLIPPPPTTPMTTEAAKRNASISSLANNTAPSQYSRAALDVAKLIVEACVTNERWRHFVEHRLPKINERQRDAPLGGEDAERQSSLASPRVDMSAMLEGTDVNEISHLDLGLSPNEDEDSGTHVLTFRGNDSDDDDDDDEVDSDEEEMDETDPARLAELQARYGFGAASVSNEDSNTAKEDDWGFADGGNENDGIEGDDVNVGDGGGDDGEGWGDFDSPAASTTATTDVSTKEDNGEDVPPAPQVEQANALPVPSTE